mgnify:CR=1 FL=1
MSRIAWAALVGLALAGVWIVVTGGELRSRKGLNLPGIDLGINAFTQRDRECLAFALENPNSAAIRSPIALCIDRSKSQHQTEKPVAKIFKLSLPTLDKYADEGLIRSQRIGTRILYSEEDIQKALKEIPVKYSRR